MVFVLRFENPPERAGVDVQVRKETVVGRAQDCGVRVDDPRASQHHARLVPRAGQLFVEDLGSPHGTVVNGLRVARQALVPGDLLVVGRHRLRVQPQGDTPRRSEVTEELVKPVSGLLSPSLEGVGRDAFYEALGLGDDTVLDAGPDAAVHLLRKTRNFAVLYEVSRALRAAHTPRGMLGRLLDLVLEVTGGDRGFVALGAYRVQETEEVNAEEDTVPPAGAEPLQVKVEVVRTRNPARAGMPPPLSSTVARHVLTERCAVLSSNSVDDTRFSDSESLFLSETRALMAVPILLRDKVLGALVVESERLGVFSEADLDLLSVISSTVGQTLENLRLGERREATIRALKETQAHLISTREQLVRSEQLAAIGRLASGLAHEVKNHLSPFMLADMIARKYPDDAETQSAVELMLEARQHIVDLVSEVKGFARGAEAAEGQLTATDLVELCRAVARFAACDAAVKRHRLEVRRVAEPWAQVDVPRIRQVLVNLIKNAAEALDGHPEGRIDIEVDEGEGYASIEVTDNGPGVPEELGSRVFEPFFSTKGEKGLGLGLDISRKIARSHSGDLDYVSTPGVGTRFRLRLPALADVL